MITDHAADIAAQGVHSGCLLCGALNPRSLRLSFQCDENGAVRTQYQVDGGLQGYDGILHGGVAAALLDAAMTHCLFHRGVEALTGDLHVRFVQPIHCNIMLEIRAWMVRSHPPLYRLRGEIAHGGEVKAWAEAKFMQYRTSQLSPRV